MVTQMRKSKELNDKNEFYAVKQTGSIVYLKLDLSYIFEDKNLHIRDKLTYLFDQISKSLDIKVLAIINQNGTANLEKYMNISKHALESNYCHTMIHRVCNVLDQLILNIANLNKFVIHADSSKHIPLFLNLSFACDYRIIASYSVYRKAYLNMGNLPKGGCAYFLEKMLGYSKTKKILLTNREISALEALQLGIVDQVVSINDFKYTVTQVSKQTAQLPGTAVSNIKKLVNHSINGLEDYLKFESNEFLKTSGLYDYS